MKQNVLCYAADSLDQLLILNFFLQLVDAWLSYRIASVSARAGLDWAMVGELVYYKLLACVLLLLIVFLGKAKPQLAARALVVTASVYTAFALYCMQRLVG